MNNDTSIGYAAFSYCYGLTSIQLPNGLTYIGDEAFYDCTGLTSVKIPDSVTSIGEDAFDGCTGLTDVYYTGSEEEWNSIRIDSYNAPLTTATIHYNRNWIKVAFSHCARALKTPLVAVYELLASVF